MEHLDEPYALPIWKSNMNKMNDPVKEYDKKMQDEKNAVSHVKQHISSKSLYNS